MERQDICSVKNLFTHFAQGPFHTSKFGTV